MNPEPVVVDATLHAAFRTAAARLENLDQAVYARYSKDPLEPIIGLGPALARIGFFGRDPGRDEVRHGVPFIGAGGQKVRAALYRHLYREEMPNFDASVAVGKLFFWANTVAYKPLGNKPWPMRVQKHFQPLMTEVLLRHWEGRDVITLGRGAFFWFGINQSRERRAALDEFWSSDERFGAVIEIPLALADGTTRTFRLHPLPHPSPLNATWYAKFPELLRVRLNQLDVRTDNLMLGSAPSAAAAVVSSRRRKPG